MSTRAEDKEAEEVIPSRGRDKPPATRREEDTNIYVVVLVVLVALFNVWGKGQGGRVRYTTIPTGPFPILEPRDQEISELGVVQELIMRLQNCERVGQDVHSPTKHASKGVTRLDF